MISVTLNFSSIEAARKVLLEIPESALAGTGSESAAIKSVAGDKPDPKPVKASPTPSATTGIGTTTATTSTQSEVEYPVLQKAVLTLAGKSREAAAAVAQSFGVKTFKELAADKWGAALAAVNAKLAELEAA